MFCSRCGTEVQDGAKFCPSCGLDLAGHTSGGGSPATVSQPVEKSEFDVVRDTLKDEYELLKELGRGGMAIVFKARDRSLDREVAIKVLPFSLSFDKDFVERFQREARTAAKLEHPNIIPIYRVGRTDKVIYFVMKFLRGTSLSEVIEENGPLAPGQIRQLLAQTARALHYAHRHGIVHRDIKPDNIMFDELGHAIVTDFGIAKAASGTKLTGTGMSIGTPHYMSPEQARAQPLDGRSDIYSLGVVAYQCLTGSVPFDGDDSFSIGYKHIMEDVPTPPLRGGEQRELFEIIRRMMAKSSDERFQDADKLALVLEGRAPLPAAPLSAAPTVAMKAAATKMSPVPPAASATTPTTPMPRAEPRPSVTIAHKKRSGALVGVMMVLLLGGGGAGGYWYYFLRPGGQMASGAVRGTPPAPAVVPDSATADSAAADSAAARDTAETPQPALPPTNNGSLVFEGQPRGARIKVDGSNVPDLTKAFTVPAGSHRIEVAAAGYENWSGPVVVARGEDKTFTIPAMTRLPQQRPVTPAPAPRPVARGQCDTPGDDYNLASFCFDTRPVPLEPPLVPVPAGVTGTPSRPLLFVLVSPDGKALRVVTVQQSNSLPFHGAAINYARTISYRPAEKDGRAVRAWVQLLLSPKLQ